MFTYVKLKNFLSFENVEIDLRSNSKEEKKFVSIYGENGSGKSNFVSALNFLKKSIDSFRRVEAEEKINEMWKDKESVQTLFECLFDDFNVLRYAQNCRMLDCAETTSLEYGFRYKGHEGTYIICFSDKFSYEKLYYFTGKQRGVLFELKVEEDRIITSFSKKLFGDKKVEEEIVDEINKYWGKHTFLGILQNEREKKNEQYIRDNYLKYVFDIIDMLENATVYCKEDLYRGYDTTAQKPESILYNIETGKIKKSEVDILDRSERVLRDFFTQTYADIKDVFYERKNEENDISYTLFFRKMIGGKVRNINYSKESGGTKNILKIIRSLLGAFCGTIVVVDEIDNGIHDLLLENVLLSMLDDITGQLIITTHNTHLLKKIDIKSAYIINVDYQGNKDIKCLDKYPRIQGTNNASRMYLRGMFGGVPVLDGVDYDVILDELNTAVEEEGGEQ